MKPLVRFRSRVVALPARNVDTDQIIPARFLKTTAQQGLGEQVFYDWRYDAAGALRPEFALNQPGARGAAILLAGDNFGCGSSREHAAWALVEFGFRAVISTSFADIFQQNALKNALLPIVVPESVHAGLLEWLAREPAAELVVDVEPQTLTLPDGSVVSFPLDEFSKHCLLAGVDELGYLLMKEPAIAAFEEGYPILIDTRR